MWDPPAEWLEELLLSAAVWAHPIIRQPLERRPRRDAVVRVAERRIVDVGTQGALPLLHIDLPGPVWVPFARGGCLRC